MTREKASEAARILDSICDFELIMDKIEGVFNNTEGDFEDFYTNQLFPLLKAELARRESELQKL